MISHACFPKCHLSVESWPASVERLAVTQRNPVSSSRIDCVASLNAEGSPRLNGLVKALPLSSYRSLVVWVAVHSQVLPMRSYMPYGLTPLA